MARTQGYTWEEVMLNIDIRDEAEKERKQQQDIMDEQVAEENAMGWWSLGLSIIGASVFGPLGYYVGKKVGEWGADYAHDWEDMAVDPGKFYKSEAEEFKKTRDEAATDQTKGQILQGVIDLATMYVQAGGLKEGFEGWSDLTTFGTGDDAWTVFGEADTTGALRGIEGGKYSGLTLPGDRVLPLARTLPGDQSIFAGGGTSIFKKGGLKQLSENLKKGDLKSAWATDQSINTFADLGRLAMSYKESEEEKSKGKTFGRFSS